MNVVIPYCVKDFTGAIRLLSWMAELDGCDARHEVFLLASAPCTPEQNQEVIQAAKSAFKVVTMCRQVRPDEQGWPGSCTTLFRLACEFMSKIKQPFFWCEPDCTPVKAGWRNDLESEYRSAGRPFMGCWYNHPVPHLNGNAVYPSNPLQFNPHLFSLANSPWDLASPGTTLAHAHLTSLIQHSWSPDGHSAKDRAWTFDSYNDALKVLKPNTILFHRCKDGSLIRAMRGHTASRPTVIQAVIGKLQALNPLGRTQFHHSGDLGDIVYSLCAIKAMGGGRLVLSPDNRCEFKNRELMTQARFEFIAPLLRSQRYLDEVEYSQAMPPSVGLDLNLMRKFFLKPYTGPYNLVHLYLKHAGLRTDFSARPWLEVDMPKHDFQVVIQRNLRIKNPEFDWRLLMDRYRERAVFLGTPEEHQSFSREFGSIEYRPVENLLDLARLIAGCELFIGNQSVGYAIAEALGKSAILEVSPDLSCRITHARRTNAWECVRSADLPMFRLPALRRRLTISIACFNNLELTRRCIESIFRHTSDFQLIVTDNASTDGTANYLRDLVSKHPHIRVIRHDENLGFIGAHKQAFAFVEGDYFCVMNNDIEVCDRWFETILERFEQEPKLAVCGVDGPGVCWSIRPDFAGYRGDLQEYVQGSLLVLPTPLARKHGLFSPELHFAYSEDSDLSLRMREQGYTIGLVKLPIHHQVSSTVKILSPDQTKKLKYWQQRNEDRNARRWSVYVARRDFQYSVLIQRRAAIGDVIDVSVITAALKEKWPRCQITVATLFPEVFQGNPHVARAITAINGDPFDYFYDLDLSYEWHPHKHTVSAYADICEVQIDLNVAKPALFPSIQEVNVAREKIPDNGRYLALHAGRTKWPGKDWPEERWNSLCQRALESGWKVVCIGTGGDQLPTGAVDLRGNRKLTEVAAILSRCQGFVGVDSGPSHIAQAVDCPAVVLFGAVDPKLKLFPACKVKAVVGQAECTGAHHRLPPPVVFSECEGDCMKAITVDMVSAEIQKL